MIIVLATEERAGHEGLERGNTIAAEYGARFGKFLVTVHPDGIEGELKGKGANQAWAAKELKRLIIDPENLDYKKILVSVFDIDTVVHPGYFHCLAYSFLTVDKPYRASYQPVPVYHNNIWEAPFFARVAAFSNTFWQMMQQIKGWCHGWTRSRSASHSAAGSGGVHGHPGRACGFGRSGADWPDGHDDLRVPAGRGVD
jgi:hypothetical protein